MIQNIKSSNNWIDVLNAARNTVGKSILDREPSNKFKHDILLAEHSPIRMLSFNWQWNGIKSWISQHFSRHNQYMVHFVTTSRNDRTGIERDELTQSHLVDHNCYANAQSIIDTSRKRLCNASHKETIKEWEAFLESLKDLEPELYSVCVRECVYRGFCPEINKCGYDKTKQFLDEVHEYRYGFKTKQ